MGNDAAVTRVLFFHRVAVLPVREPPHIRFLGEQVAEFGETSGIPAKRLGDSLAPAAAHITVAVTELRHSCVASRLPAGASVSRMRSSWPDRDGFGSVLLAAGAAVVVEPQPGADSDREGDDACLVIAAA